MGSKDWHKRRSTAGGSQGNATSSRDHKIRGDDRVAARLDETFKTQISLIFQSSFCIVMSADLGNRGGHPRHHTSTHPLRRHEPANP